METVVQFIGNDDLAFGENIEPRAGIGEELAGAVRLIFKRKGDMRII